MPANAFKTLFLLLPLLATCTCLLNEKKVSRYTSSNLGLRTSGLQSIYLKDLRMRPSIEFAFLDADAVWCLKESSLSIHTPKSFSHTACFLFCNAIGFQLSYESKA